MKYELWVYLKNNDFWFKAISSPNQDVIDAKKKDYTTRSQSKRKH